MKIIRIKTLFISIFFLGVVPSVLFSEVPSLDAKNLHKDIKMPNAQVLQDRLHKGTFHHFMEKTDIVSELADRNITPLGIVSVVNLSYVDYNEYFRKAKSGKAAERLMVLMVMKKRELFEALLEDKREVLKQLDDLGLLN